MNDNQEIEMFGQTIEQMTSQKSNMYTNSQWAAVILADAKFMLSPEYNPTPESLNQVRQYLNKVTYFLTNAESVRGSYIEQKVALLQATIKQAEGLFELVGRLTVLESDNDPEQAGGRSTLYMTTDMLRSMISWLRVQVNEAIDLMLIEDQLKNK